MGEWYEVKPKPWSPCDGCQIQKTVNGKLFQKTDDCHETCKRYKKWCRDGIKAIVGNRKEALIRLAEH